MEWVLMILGWVCLLIGWITPHKLSAIAVFGAGIAFFISAGIVKIETYFDD